MSHIARSFPLIILFFISSLSCGSLSAQHTIGPDKVSTATLPSAWNSLLLSAPELKDQFKTQEAILDLVQICSSHPEFEAKKAFQSGMAGFSTLDRNRYWEAIEMTKQKFVGTSIQPSKFFHSAAVPNERDVCIYSVPHLPHYIEMAGRGLEKADRKRPGKRKIKHYPLAADFNKGDCNCDPLLKATKKKKEYCRYVECECTWEDGNDSLRQVLIHKFAPPLKSIDPKNELESSRFLPMGVYGPFVSDCVHNCKPEIHPYEWIWWMEFDAENPNRKTWKMGFIKDQSERYIQWAPEFLQGRASIPFSVPRGKSLYIEIEPLVHNELDCISLACEPRQGEIPLAGLLEPMELRLEKSDTRIFLSLKSEQGLKGGASFSVSGLNEDPNTGTVSGYFDIAVSARSLFTACVSTEVKAN